MRLVLTLKKRLLLLLLTFVLGYLIFGILYALVVAKVGEDSTPAMRILVMLQDIMLFILPAIATAVIVTRQPAELLCIATKPPFWPTVLAVCVLIVSIPAMNWIIWLNQNIPLPESWRTYLETLENNANSTIYTVLGAHTIPNFIVSVLIVAVFAALSEELFFRGALQRLLSTGEIRVSCAIWLSAFAFTLLHLQFLGIVPRLLLGAYFGYLLVWTRSLWVPVIAHACNNAIFLLGEWETNDNEESIVNMLGSEKDYIWIAVSIGLVALGIRLLYLQRSRIADDNCVDCANDTADNQA